MKTGYRAVATVLATTALLFSAPAAAQTFSAKRVTFIVGYGVGGGYDTATRLLARHIGKHLPGNPAVVVQNQTGAGGLTAANLLYNGGPKDGSMVGMFASSVPLEPLFGNDKAKFDPAGWIYIGNVNRDVLSCVVHQKTGIKTWEEAMKKGASFGATGPSAGTAQHAYYMKNMLKAPFKIILGFKGTKAINLAMQRGEIDGSCGMFLSTAQGPYRAQYESGELIPIIQFGKSNEPFFRNAKNVYSILQNEEDRKVTEFIFEQAAVTRPVMGPPGMPAPIVATLREAFDKTVKDPAYIADAKKMGQELFPMSGKETQAAYAEFLKTPKPLLEKAKKAIRE